MKLCQAVYATSADGLEQSTPVVRALADIAESYQPSDLAFTDQAFKQDLSLLYRVISYILFLFLLVLYYIYCIHLYILIYTYLSFDFCWNVLIHFKDLDVSELGGDVTWTPAQVDITVSEYRLYLAEEMFEMISRMMFHCI